MQKPELANVVASSGRVQLSLRSHPCLPSSSRAIALIVPPSALPLNWGRTLPITAPICVAPPAIAALTAALSSSSLTAGGRYFSSAAPSARSLSARSARPALSYISTDSRRFLIALRSTSTTSLSSGSRRSSMRRFFTSERTVPRRRVAPLSCAFREAFRSPCNRARSSDISDPPGTAVLAHSRVQLALAALTRLLVMTVLAKIGKDARFLALLLEALQRALKVLVVMDYDFRQNLLPPFVAFVAPVYGYRLSKLAGHTNPGK